MPEEEKKRASRELKKVLNAHGGEKISFKGIDSSTFLSEKVLELFLNGL
jgi:hypothetical protein